MSLPEPELGLVISYVYLWHFERSSGRDEGAKDRPSVVVSVEATSKGTMVTVLPITHRDPRPRQGIEIPLAIKRHLRLDDQRSWIIVDEGNEFLWAGFDVRPIGRTGDIRYGFLPPRFFVGVLDAFRAFRRAAPSTLVSRD